MWNFIKYKAKKNVKIIHCKFMVWSPYTISILYLSVSILTKTDVLKPTSLEGADEDLRAAWRLSETACAVHVPNHPGPRPGASPSPAMAAGRGGGGVGGRKPGAEPWRRQPLAAAAGGTVSTNQPGRVHMRGYSSC